MMILWKEWRQQKSLFLLWCLVGITFPALEAYMTWKRSGKMHSDLGTGVILGFGALFAMILAVATTSADSKKGLCEFWQSKPVSPARLFVVKFLLAALLLLISFLFILSFDFFTSRFFAGYAWVALCYTFPLALMLFAISMFLTVLLRDSAKAILIAIWVGLLVYFLPLLIGSLEWMNIFYQMDNTYNRPSVIRYLIWAWSLPVKMGSHITETYRPAGIPVSFYEMTRFQALSQIVSSLAYLQYLLFVAVTTVVSVICGILSVKAVKNRWLWQPGQKTIVWSIGLSIACIFGISLFQVRQNLLLATTHRGKQISPYMNLQDKPKKTYDWLDAEVAGEIITIRWGTGHNSHACVKDEFMYLISRNPAPHPSWPGKPPQDPDSKDFHEYNASRQDMPVRHDWLLDFYQHPIVQGNGKHLARVRFFSTPPIRSSERQPVVACFIRNGRLYVGYRPGIGQNNQWPRAYEYGESPLMFLVVDIGNPKEPKLFSNEVIHQPKNFWGQKKTGVSNYGDYCYVAYDSELHIISVENPDQPALFKTLTTKDLSIPVPHDYLSVVDGDKLICHNYEAVLLLDISKPTEPKIIFYGKFEVENSNTDMIYSATYSNDNLFITRISGIYVYHLSNNSDGDMTSKLIGRRRASPLERLLSRHPKQLIVKENLLFEAACGFGILVYDISNPAQPRRLYHGGDGRYIDTIGFWDDLLYTADLSYYSGPFLRFYEIPQSN